MAHHLAQGGPGEQLERHHRRHRVAGQAEHRRVAGPATPKASGLAGRMATCNQSHAPDPVEHHLHEVEVAHAHAAAGDDRVARRPAPPRDGGRMASSSSRAGPRSTASQPASPHQGEQRGAVGVADLARAAGRRRPSTSSSPVDSTPTRAGREHGAPRQAEAGQHAEVAGREHGAGAKTTWPGRRSSPARPDVVAGAARPPRSSRRRRRRPACPLDHHDGVGARRASGAPVMMRTASPGPTGRRPAGRRRRPACRPPSSRDRGAGGVGRPHREAVHGRCWRTAARRAAAVTGSASHPPEGLGQRHGRRGWQGQAARRGSVARASSSSGSRRRAGIRRASCAARGRRGRRGTRGRGRRGRWRARPWPAGSRASCRCRSGRPRTR